MTRYLEQLNETTDPTTGDYLPIYDASAGSTDKDRKVNVSRFAILANAQTFTVTQTVAPTATNVDGVIVNMPTSTTNNGISILYNGTNRLSLTAKAGSAALQLNGGSNDLGNGNPGGSILLGANTNATANCAGYIGSVRRGNGAADYIWNDNTGVWRTSTSAPTNATDTGGTVIGAQTSMAEAKDISDELPDLRASLGHIVDAAKHGLRAWRYKSGAYGDEFFPIGIVTDYSPRYGMDRDAEHPAGKALNIPVAIGDLMAAVTELSERLAPLEGKLR